MLITEVMVLVIVNKLLSDYAKRKQGKKGKETWM